MRSCLKGMIFQIHLEFYDEICIKPAYKYLGKQRRSHEIFLTAHSRCDFLGTVFGNITKSPCPHGHTPVNVKALSAILTTSSTIRIGSDKPHIYQTRQIYGSLYMRPHFESPYAQKPC